MVSAVGLVQVCAHEHARARHAAAYAGQDLAQGQRVYLLHFVEQSKSVAQALLSAVVLFSAILAHISVSSTVGNKCNRKARQNNAANVPR